MIRILSVDDSALVRRLLGQVFGAEPDFEVAFARNGLEGIEKLQSFQPDVVTLDIHMPQMDGLATLDRIMLERPCPVIMVSSLTEEGAEITLEALRLGAVDFVAKPGGAVSLKLDRFGPELVSKVRAAAGARIPTSLRLADRVRHRLGARLAPTRRSTPSTPKLAAATGQGLVVVGVSTGGPPALEALLRPLTADFPWPILIAQHMPATFTSSLARRLDGLCALKVTEISEPTALKAGTAYIGRGDADVVVARRGAVLTAEPVASDQAYPWHPSTDRLVRSAMEHVAARQLIGVLMTGMGDDGAQAMAALRAAGGRTVAESEETAIVWGMPGELVKAGGADFILPVHKIAARLESLTP
ncbi:chemotaxis response regulator protein-glutamate methylesterase [Phenylobacterium hankyongense]|uniref:Protein-glutamate methylesterase/protein-glutamine glutaminase n=1 Tax=Phenylobacterium hankyongense TaxID=1813876 RepID=A0A328B0P7_9CAUL|nr:chemotaxis-specific protein-glutamate methyltransferase CheB [Phenylobacterium hankyongense]RAK60992.1 chemotaxis response regulator protein-glutamate methylesterase [Phenylobacterium hankyongense]